MEQRFPAASVTTTAAPKITADTATVSPANDQHAGVNPPQSIAYGLCLTNAAVGSGIFVL
jgi:hypothetical protein